MMVAKGIRVRLYPTDEQETLINKTIGCCRLIVIYEIEWVFKE